MARIGGRNAVFAWIVGIVCAATIAGLAFLAVPLLPASFTWLTGTLASPVSEPVAADEDEVTAGAPAECRGLYADALWAGLVWTPESDLRASTDPPLTTATGLVDALQPAVRFTCAWTSAEGTISTTLADVPVDAGAIAEAALPSSGFSCADHEDRVRCTRAEGEVVETIEAGGGVWLSTLQDGWQPSNYASRVAGRVWAD